MRKKKHGAERIAACADLLIEDTAPLATLGTNPTAIFPEEKPIHLEIGCGKGAFAVGMAAANPQFNLIAM
jgi:tRNA (guanine-N7-)-methyltransferase